MDNDSIDGESVEVEYTVEEESVTEEDEYEEVSASEVEDDVQILGATTEASPDHGEEPIILPVAESIVESDDGLVDAESAPNAGEQLPVEEPPCSDVSTINEEELPSDPPTTEEASESSTVSKANNVPALHQSIGISATCTSVEAQIGSVAKHETPETTRRAETKSNQANATLSSDKAFEWEKPSWTTAKLRSTGKNLKKGEDLQAPITFVEKKRLDDINFEANPMLLRPTKKGVDVRLGDNLAKPITHCEKDPQAGINTVVSAQGLKNTEKGQGLAKGVDLQAPITHVQKDTLDDVNFEANPLILKSTEKGQDVRLGGKLERPITFINSVSN